MEVGKIHGGFERVAYVALGVGQTAIQKEAFGPKGGGDFVIVGILQLASSVAPECRNLTNRAVGGMLRRRILYILAHLYG